MRIAVARWCACECVFNPAIGSRGRKFTLQVRAIFIENELWERESARGRFGACARDLLAKKRGGGARDGRGCAYEILMAIVALRGLGA